MNVWDEIKTWWRTGGVLLRLIIINVAVFLALLFVSLGAIVAEGDRGLASQWLESKVVPWIAASSDPLTLLTRPWTVFSYMFTHVDLGHVFFNLLMLWVAGRSYSNLLPDRQLLGTYLLGGLTGLLAYLLCANVPALHVLAHPGNVKGASASVLGVLAFIATYRPENEISLIFFRLRLKWFALLLLLLDLVSINETQVNSGGHIAHLGGALYGYLAALQLKKGNDWSLGFINGLERIGSALHLRRGARLKVVKTPRGKRVSDADFNAARNAQQSNIDAILDKISRSGYESLSKAEKDILFKASNEGKR